MLLKSNMSTTILRQLASRRSAATTLAIRRENVDWERRAPFTPAQVGALKAQNPGLKVLIQPSNQRCFGIHEYEAVGAVESEDLSSADFIVGVKQVAIDQLLEGKTYMFFSHTIKGQKDNMPMLDAILDKKIRLIDYEKLQKDGHGHRTVAFGKWAGVAGAIDILSCLGMKLQALKMDSPFFRIARPHNYSSIDECYRHLRANIQPELEAFARKRNHPFTFVCTGNGNVSQGAQEVLNQLGIEWVAPRDLKAVKESGRYDKTKIYGTVVDLKDHLSHERHGRFNIQDFLERPDKYKSNFRDEIAPYANVIINGILWMPGHPRLLSNEDLPALKHLYAVADITADPDGSLEFMQECTSLDDPYRFFDTEKQESRYGFTGNGFNYSSVDNLPTQVAPEASAFFGEHLSHLVPDLLKAADPEKTLQNLFADGLNPEVANAIITSEGGLAPRFENIAEMRKANTAGMKKVLVLGAGSVVGPLVRYLDQAGFAQTLASQSLEEAQTLAARCEAANVNPIKFELEQELERLHRLCDEHDLVISLVPYTLHHHVAEAALSTKTNMLTASYESDVLKSYDESFKAAGIFCINELGLDPGIDHMLAMELFDEVRGKGGSIKSFISFCGGLPAPECSDNPLGYKFSWSPRGVLMAAMNPAIFQENGEIKEIPAGGEILKNRMDADFYKGFALEAVANRNSLGYKDPYALQDVDTILRGTLRYEGYCDLVYGLQGIGLLSLTDPIPEGVQSWNDIVNAYDWENKLKANSKNDVEAIKAEMAKLGLFSTEQLPEKVLSQPNILDAFAVHLAELCAYGPGERDLVLLRHEIISEEADGSRRQHDIDFVQYGESYGWSAMSKTVSLPVAIAAKLLLQGQIKGQKGMVRPLEKDVYAPILKELRRMDLGSNYSVKPLSK